MFSVFTTLSIIALFHCTSSVYLSNIKRKKFSCDLLARPFIRFGIGILEINSVCIRLFRIYRAYYQDVLRNKKGNLNSLEETLCIVLSKAIYTVSAKHSRIFNRQRSTLVQSDIERICPLLIVISNDVQRYRFSLDNEDLAHAQLKRFPTEIAVKKARTNMYPWIGRLAILAKRIRRTFSSYLSNFQNSRCWTL